MKPYLNEQIIQLLKDDPQFAKVYEDFTSSAWQNGHLSAKEKYLLQVALGSSPTHLNIPSATFAMQKALEAGATEKEIAEVIKVASILGVHTCVMGVPIMMENFERPSEVHYSEQQLAMKQQFIDTMGYWNEFRDDLLRIDTPFYKAYFDYLTVPVTRGILERKFVEFIYIAIDASTTHLFASGTAVHIKNAIQYGATLGELLEVIQLTSAQGFDSLLTMLPILQQQVAQFNQRKE